MSAECGQPLGTVTTVKTSQSCNSDPSINRLWILAMTCPLIRHLLSYANSFKNMGNTNFTMVSAIESVVEAIVSVFTHPSSSSIEAIKSICMGICETSSIAPATKATLRKCFCETHADISFWKQGHPYRRYWMTSTSKSINSISIIKQF